MNIVDNASPDVHTHGGGEIPPSTGLTPDALPEVQKPVQAEKSHTGVSTKYVPLPKEMQEARREARKPHWYALRVTYGREKKTYDYLVGKHVEAYYPTIKTTKEVDG
ncbi:MAG: transcription termination/antitermination NusG family protein, partial [Bacteroidaceae bacterium]